MQYYFKIYLMFYLSRAVVRLGVGKLSALAMHLAPAFFSSFCQCNYKRALFYHGVDSKALDACPPASRPTQSVGISLGS